MENLQIFLKVAGIFVPALVGSLIYIYNRQLKSIFHQINENIKSIKELDKRIDDIDKAQGILEALCDKNHKE